MGRMQTGRSLSRASGSSSKRHVPCRSCRATSRWWTFGGSLRKTPPPTLSWSIWTAATSGASSGTTPRSRTTGCLCRCCSLWAALWRRSTGLVCSTGISARRTSSLPPPATSSSSTLAPPAASATGAPGAKRSTSSPTTPPTSSIPSSLIRVPGPTCTLWQPPSTSSSPDRR